MKEVNQLIQAADNKEIVKKLKKWESLENENVKQMKEKKTYRGTVEDWHLINQDDGCLSNYKR